MALTSELMALGIAARPARALGHDALATGLTATGSTAADAFVLTSSASRFDTVGSGTGALLPAAEGRAPFLVQNAGSNALTVYPASTSEKVNNATSFSVTNGKSAIFWPLGNGWIANLSA